MADWSCFGASSALPTLNTTGLEGREKGGKGDDDPLAWELGRRHLQALPSTVTEMGVLDWTMSCRIAGHADMCVRRMAPSECQSSTLSVRLAAMIGQAILSTPFSRLRCGHRPALSRTHMTRSGIVNPSR